MTDSQVGGQQIMDIMVHFLYVWHGTLQVLTEQAMVEEELEQEIRDLHL